MPNRILRDGILRSEKVAQLSPMAELFYRRLMSVVDDFGRYYAKPSLLLSDCFPIRPSWADEPSLSLWIEECVAFGLIARYAVSGTEYIEIHNFNQRIREGRGSKFPPLADFGGQVRQISAAGGSRASSTPPPSAPTTHTASEEKKDEEILRPEFDDQWQHFRKLYEESGKPLIEEDFTRAHHAWRVLDFEQRTAAIVGITNRYEAGEWEDPRYIPKPEKYLTSEYKRVVVAKRSRIAAQLGRNDAQRAAVDHTALGKLEAEAAPWLALHPGKTINDFVDWQLAQSVN